MRINLNRVTEKSRIDEISRKQSVFEKNALDESCKV